MNRPKRFATLALIALLAAACDNAVSSSSVQTTIRDSTVATSTTTSSPTTATPTTTNTTLLAGATIGTTEALIEFMAPTLDAVEALYDIQPTDVPIPDTHGGPEAGLRELLSQEFWVYSHAPLESWAGVLAREGSPDWELLRSFYNTIGFRVATFDASIQNPYLILEARLASDSEISTVPVGIIEEAGEGSMVVYFRSSLEPHDLVDTEEPSFTQEREGWSDKASLSVIVPTAVGWQYFWSESR